MNLAVLAQEFQELNKRERFLYLLELGEELPDYSQEHKKKEFEVPGCTSLVYIHPTKQGDKLHFQGYAAAKAVKGYVYILTQSLSNKTPQEILQDKTIPRFIQEAQMNLTTQVSRAEAFGTIYQFIQEQARVFK
jgi:cysteine desulfuration protein SufE